MVRHAYIKTTAAYVGISLSKNYKREYKKYENQSHHVCQTASSKDSHQSHKEINHIITNIELQPPHNNDATLRINKTPF